MNLNVLYSACNEFWKAASDQNKEEKYANFMADFIAIRKTHPKYDWAVDKIKEMLATEEGQSAFETAFGIAWYDTIPAVDLEDKVSLFIPLLRKDIKKEMVRWLDADHAKQFLNDPDVEIQEMVARIMGIDPDWEYDVAYKPKEIKDEIPQVSTPPEP
ncbi:MAG TPA: hypothetical protein VI423_04565, partial [Paenisporosarcina sp.]|nr:hypothetical protein [Paenisporosarcina sp.]